MPNSKLKKALAYGSAGLIATASALGVMFYGPTILNNVSANTSSVLHIMTPTEMKKIGLTPFTSKRAVKKNNKKLSATDVYKAVLRKSGWNKLSEDSSESQVMSAVRKATSILDKKTDYQPSVLSSPHIPSANGVEHNGATMRQAYKAYVAYNNAHYNGKHESFYDAVSHSFLAGLDPKGGGSACQTYADMINNHITSKSPSGKIIGGLPMFHEPAREDLGITYGQDHQKVNKNRNLGKRGIPIAEGTKDLTPHVGKVDSHFVEKVTGDGFGNRYEGAPAHRREPGIFGKARDYGLGHWHSYLEATSLEDKGKNAPNSVIKVTLPKKPPKDPIEILYPNSAVTRDPNHPNSKKRISLDTKVVVFGLHYYNPWDGSHDSRFYGGEADNTNRSLVFSKDLYDGFMYNGLDDLHVSYQFYKHGSKTPINLNKDMWLEFRHINGLSSYNDKAPVGGGGGVDASGNNQLYTSSWYKRYFGDTRDRIGESVQNGNDSDPTQDEYAYPGSREKHMYSPYTVDANLKKGSRSATGGRFNYGGRYLAHYRSDLVFKLSGTRAYFHNGSSVGYGNIQPFTHIHGIVPVYNNNCINGNCNPQGNTWNPPTTPPSNPNPVPTPITKYTGKGIHRTNTVNGLTASTLNTPGQVFDYNINGSIPARTYRTNGWTTSRSNGSHTPPTTIYHWTDKNPNDHYKFYDNLPKDVTVTKLDSGIPGVTMNQRPIGNGQTQVYFELNGKQMSKLTGSADSDYEGTTPFDQSQQKATKNLPFKATIQVRVNHLPKAKDNGNESSDSGKNPWKGTNSQNLSDYKELHSDNNEKQQGWYRFLNGGDTGPDQTWADEEVDGNSAKKYTKPIIVQIKRIRASIWHYDYDWTQDDGADGMHDGETHSNFFPDNEQSYGLGKKNIKNERTDQNWISTQGLGYSKKADKYRKEHENPKNPNNSANGEKFPYRYNKYFYGYSNSLKHYYHYGYEGDYYKAPVVDRYKDKNRTEHFRLVYPHHKDSGWTSGSGKGANAFDPKTGKDGGYVIIPMHSNVGGHSLNSYSVTPKGQERVSTTEGFRQTTYLPYIVPRIDLWPKGKFGNKAGRVIIDTDHACHGLPFRFDMRPINYLYGSNIFGGGYQSEFGDAKVQLSVTAGNSDNGPLLYRETRPLIGNSKDAVINEDKSADGGYNHYSQLDEWPEGSNGWKGYIQQSAINHAVSDIHDPYNLDTKKILNCGYHGKLPLHFNLKVINNTGQAQVDPININTYGYLTAGHRITAKDFGHKITYGQGADENGHGTDLKKSENNQNDGSDKPDVHSIRPNRATIVAPERTLHYGSDPDSSDDTRELNEKISVSQPRNAVAKTGYGMSANDLGIHYAGHLMAKPYAHAGTNMDYAFPQAFNSKDSDISYAKDARHATLDAHGKKDQALMDQLIHVQPKFHTTDGYGASGTNGMGENQDLNPNDPQELDTGDDNSSEMDADKQFDTQFGEGLYAGRFSTQYGFYPRASIHNNQTGSDKPDTYNGNVLLGTFGDGETGAFHHDKASVSNRGLAGKSDQITKYNDPFTNGQHQYTFNTKNGSHTISNESHHIANHPIDNILNRRSDDGAEQIGTNGQNERMFTPKFMKLGTYQTAFERPYTSHGKGSRKHRLGTNFFDIDEKRPVHFYAHEFISKNEKPSQPYDELSLQPILTNPKNGLSQVPQSSPAFPNGWLNDNLWANSFSDQPID